jgi:hypothetical protein
MADAGAYINNPSTSLPTLSGSRWSDTISGAKDLLNQKANGEPELSFLKRSYDAPGCFGPKTEKAAGLVLSANQNKVLPQVASLRR